MLARCLALQSRRGGGNRPKQSFLGAGSSCPVHPLPATVPPDAGGAAAGRLRRFLKSSELVIGRLRRSGGVGWLGEEFCLAFLASLSSGTEGAAFWSRLAFPLRGLLVCPPTDWLPRAGIEYGHVDVDSDQARNVRGREYLERSVRSR